MSTGRKKQLNVKNTHMYTYGCTPNKIEHIQQRRIEIEKGDRHDRMKTSKL